MRENYTIITKKGREKMAAAIALGQKLDFTYFALGDGGGEPYDPTEDQTALKHEVYRGETTAVTLDDSALNTFLVAMFVPATVGGWYVREMGVFDIDGDLIAISKTPDDPKPSPESGSTKEMTYRMFVTVAASGDVEIKIDPNFNAATHADLKQLKKELEEYVKTQTEASKKYVDEAIGGLRTDVDEIIENMRTQLAGDGVTTIKSDKSIVTISGGITERTYKATDGSIVTITTDTMAHKETIFYTEFGQNEAGEKTITTRSEENEI